MKYAMKQSDGLVGAIIRLRADGTIPPTFVEISKGLYEEGIDILSSGAFYLTYDDSAKTLRADNTRGDNVRIEIKRVGQRRRLKRLYLEKQTKQGLGEDITAVDSEIATIQNDYNATP